MKTTFSLSAKHINRATITDGKLLNRFVVEPLSSRDNEVLENLNEVAPNAISVYETVQDNYQTNWPNSALTGFKEFKLGSTTLTGAANVTGVIPLSSSKEIQLLGTPASKTISINTTNDILQSYYAVAMKNDGYIDNDYSVAFNDCSATVSSFAFGHKASAHNWRNCIK